MKRFNKEGFALITVVAFSVILLTTLVYSLSFVFSHYKITKKRENWEEKYYLCEAGLKAGRWIIQNPAVPTPFFDPNADYYPDDGAGSLYTYNWSFNNRMVKINISGDPNAGINYRISTTVIN